MSETQKLSAEDSSMLYQYYVGWFIFLLAALWIFRKASGSASSGNQPAAVVTADFKRFQRSYVLVYLIMMGADWLQGPYVYALYKHYGFSIGDIAKLFIVGFGSSLFFGTIVGSMADKYGRKLMCIVFGIMYTLSCVTKHFPDYNILLVGRVLGGIATSILFSSFESWMVHEHHEASYPEEWLGITFSVCTSGNGIVAIGSGVVASFARDKWGPVAPFDVSMICLVIGTCLVAFTWVENTGDSKINFSLTLSNAMSRLQEDKKIALLGLIQSFFEGAMYVFVFMWTPALESTSTYPIYHGWIFASFMICTLIGSGLFKFFLDRGLRVERTSMYMFAVSAFVLVLPNFTLNHSLRLAAFFVFEICVGMFWPSLGFMRSRYVPEEVRATVMNFFRIPLNCIVVIVLYNIDALQPYVFSVCGLCLVLAFICQVQLVKLTVDSPEVGKKGVELESLSSGH